MMTIIIGDDDNNNDKQPRAVGVARSGASAHRTLMTAMLLTRMSILFTCVAPSTRAAAAGNGGGGGGGGGGVCDDDRSGP